jgi:hypothetical protein
MEREIAESNRKKNNMSIEWAKDNADIMALAGIWKDKPRTIEEIREKAWKRDWLYVPDAEDSSKK